MFRIDKSYALVRRGPRHRFSGFTLLEMMIVMVLLGMIASLTLPAMQRWHDALLARSEVSTVMEALQAAAFDAGAKRQTLMLDSKSFVIAGADRSTSSSNAASVNAEARVQVNLPAGWQVKRSVPAMFGADGLCRPGLVALRSASGNHLLFAIKGPICQIEWTTDHASAEAPA